MNAIQVRNFNIKFDEIELNPFFSQIIKPMPKGALLHCHISAIVNVYKFLKYLKQNNYTVYSRLYILTNKQKLEEYKKLLIDNYMEIYKQISDNPFLKSSMNSYVDLAKTNHKVLEGQVAPSFYDPQKTLAENRAEFQTEINRVDDNNNFVYDELRKKITGGFIIDENINSIIRLKDGPCYDGIYKRLIDMYDDDIIEYCNAFRMNDLTEYNWPTLYKKTSNYWTIYRDIDYVVDYIKFFLDQCIEENLQHVEIKASFKGNFNLSDMQTCHLSNGSTIKYYLFNWTLQQTPTGPNPSSNTYKNLIDKILTLNNTIHNGLYKNKISFNLIGAIGKQEHGRNNQNISKQIYPKPGTWSTGDLATLCTTDYNKLSAVDLLDEEDKSLPITSYIGTLINDCSHKNLVLHSGETTSDKTMFNNNLLSVAMLQNTNRSARRYTNKPELKEDKIFRIGHGLDLIRSDDPANLAKRTELYEIYKKMGIHVELCPLSNYILNYVKDLSKHPGKDYLRDGIRVSINSDDPSPFGYDRVSYDWLFAIYYWNLTVNDIYKLAMYSLEDSTLNSGNKNVVIAKFTQEWQNWKNKNQVEDNTILREKFSREFDEIIVSSRQLTQQQIDAELKFQQDESAKLAVKLAVMPGGNKDLYYKKYLKYKQKYLELKNQL
jgi:adenosine deaminase